jgi:transcriptional regulatory protein GAL4
VLHGNGSDLARDIPEGFVTSRQQQPVHTEASSLRMANPRTQDTRPSSSSVLSLGSGDQACNECKRRKGRCDRQLPECGPCARNKRHCLYERNSKTPLTRRYLTEVEARLRQTELRLRDAEQRARLAETQLQTVQLAQPSGHGAQTNTQGTSAAAFPAIHEGAESLNSYLHNPMTEHNNVFVVPPTYAGGAGSMNEQQANGTDHFSRTTYQGTNHMSPSELEQPPSGLEDFSWDEQSAGDELEHAPASVVEDADSPGVTDSMASLSIDDKRAGYLGIASGAAMLRLLMPDAEHRPKRPAHRSHAHKHSVTSDTGDLGWVPTPVFKIRHIEEIDMDAAINSYFSLYHISYPIVCEPTFRAQYAQVIPRPNGRSWNALAYIIAAIGLFTTATEPVVRDLDLFEAAKANISIDSLETGNITLVQALALISNYIQKRGKPNSGYNYLGLALHMAMGLGMHKEFQNWRIAPLQMEIRRRVWWALYNFYVGAAITFGRPLAWPANGIEVALPLNVDDRDLTHFSVSLPPPRSSLTTHSAVSDQARFHLMTSEIYARVISLPFPSARELLQLDEERINAWYSIWTMEADKVEARFILSRSVMEWRYRNLRVIMFRPFVIRRVLQARMRQKTAPQLESATDIAIARCLAEAKASIISINTFWTAGRRTCMASWYALYFLFQASMIPSVCLRNDPTSSMAQDWREQLDLALNVMQSMFSINPSSRECHEVVRGLCSNYLLNASGVPSSSPNFGMEPVEESPNTQIEGLYSMMWPSANTTEVDMLIENDSWNNFIADLPDDSPNFLDRDFEDFRFA